MARLPIFYLSDTVLEVGKGGTALQKQVSGDAITSGTVTATIWNMEGSSPAQVGGTITLTHQGSPDGYWSGNIDDDFGSSGLTNGMHVQIRISADGGAGFKLYMEIDGVVEVYRGD
jgi:hypothetical protein